MYDKNEKHKMFLKT